MNWNLEGKVAGYNKKTLAIVVLVILAGVIFYAGTRYEKMRLSHLKGSSASVSNSAIKKNGSKKQPAAMPQQPTSGVNNGTTSSTAPAVVPPVNNTANQATTTTQK